MDEHKLTELFREAVRDTPPASFDERDVTNASQRIARRRRRTAVVAGTLSAVLLFGLAAVGVSQLVRFPTVLTNAAPGMASGKAETSPYSADGSLSAPSAPPAGDKASPNAAGAVQVCGPVDRDLADALSAALPVASGPQPVQGGGFCPPGTRAAGFVVHDGAVTGVFSVVLTPVEGAAPSVEGGKPPGTRGSAAAACTGTVCSITAASGKTLTVRSEPNQGLATAPLANEVPLVAQHLASRF